MNSQLLSWIEYLYEYPYTPPILGIVRGSVPKRSNGPDCKSGGLCLRGFESLPAHHSTRPAIAGLAHGKPPSFL